MNSKLLPLMSTALFIMPWSMVSNASAQDSITAVAVDSHMVSLIGALTDGKFEQLDILSRENIPAAMLSREVRVGVSARRWTDLEVAKFEKLTGYRPTELYFTADVVAVLANEENPNQEVTLQQLRDVFGCNDDVLPTRWSTWGEETETPLMLPFAVDEGLKLHHTFHEWVTCKEGTYAATQFVADEEGLEEALDDNEQALAYVTYSKRWQEANILSVVDDRGDRYDVNKETILSGRYPLSSVYYLYLDLPPHRNYFSPSEKQFIELALSQEHQSVLNRYGFISLPEQAIWRNYVKLGLEPPIVEGGYK